jgi:putative DNA primase/helicase
MVMGIRSHWFDEENFEGAVSNTCSSGYGEVPCDQDPAKEILSKGTRQAADRYDGVPDALEKLNQWVLWKLEKRNNGKPTKVPYQPNGMRASTTAPRTWSDFKTCKDNVKNFDGIGFVFKSNGGIIGIDLDHCINEEGELECWAKEVVNKFGPTYVEFSPSGDGLHIICLGNLNRTGSCKWTKPTTKIEQGLEIYDQSRYFTVSGKAISGLEIINCQNGIDWIVETYFPTREASSRTETESGSADPQLVQEALKYISSDERFLWIKTGIALKNDGFPFELWKEWSSKSKKYNEMECAKTWQTFKIR